MDEKINKNHTFDFKVAVGWIRAVSLIFFVAGALIHSRQDSWLVSLLFLLPLGVQLWGLRALKNRFDHPSTAREIFSWFYLLTMVVCLISYLFLWCIYNWWERQHLWLEKSNWNHNYWNMYQKMGGSTLWLKVCMVIALIAILFLLYFALRMTWAIIEGNLLDSKTESTRKGWKILNLDYLKTGATQEPFLSLLFFLTVFLGVSYLFGLALGFHDKSLPPIHTALYMKNFYFPRSEFTDSPPLNPPATSSTQTAAPKSAPGPALYSFGFGGAQALVAGVDEQPQIFKTKSQESDWQKNMGPNDSEMKALVDEIEKETKDHNRIRVAITGFADEGNISSSAYQSNYELGMARAENIKRITLDKLTAKLNSAPSNSDDRWRDIEWLTLSASNEQQGSGKLVRVKIERIPQNPMALQGTQLKAELTPHLDAERPAPLNLMDYVYFANYTITTTGYGDIVPNSGTAKFICSFANICEVFFLVVLFNALLSLSGHQAIEKMAGNISAIHDRHANMKELPDRIGAIEGRMDAIKDKVDEIDERVPALHSEVISLLREMKRRVENR